MGRFDVAIHDSYDPEALGANCGSCVLRKIRAAGPTGPEYHDKATAAVVTDFPRDMDATSGRPFAGPHGMLFNKVLVQIGQHRTGVDIHHAVACMPPGADLEKVMLRWQRDNKKRVSAGEEPLPSPIDCCRPRLMAELEHHDVITLGRVAYQALTGRARPIFDIRGGPVDGAMDGTGRFVTGLSRLPPDHTRVRVLPTLHPGHVQKAARWTKAFQADLGRAFRWFRGQLGWKDPHMVFNPDPDYLERFLSGPGPYVYDVETTVDDPLLAKLKCIGIGTAEHTVCVHLLSIEGPNGQLVPGPYTATDEASVRGILRAFFGDESKLKAGHNSGAFDRVVIEEHFGVTPAPMIDTILLHKAVESELPHTLGYVGSVYTDVTSWKEAHTATEARTDEELGRYCQIDVSVTARALPVLAEAARKRGQEQVVAFDHQAQELCVGLHRNGMLVDVERRNFEAKRLLAEITDRSRIAREIAGKPDINLNSTLQLRDLFFAEWGLAPAEYTALGDPSTSDEALRLMRAANKDNPQVRSFIDALRRFRSSTKEYGTYIKRLVPYRVQFEAEPEWSANFEGYEASDRSQDKVEQKKRSRGLILPDGRVHPDYKAHGATSGRLSCSNPNAQNQPKHLRGIIVAQPGRVIVGADADQLELRSIASIAGIDRYLEIFRQGGDPHSETAALMFGKAFTNLVPKSEDWAKLRNLAKSIKYASFYGAGDETVHGLVTSAEDKEGNLIYADLSLREVATLKRNWLKGIPELPRWWEVTLEEYREQGYLLDPVLLRRRDFLDGENFNEIVNFRIQSGSAHVVNQATFDLLKVIPFQKWGPGTGLIAHVHDALYVEAPCHHDQHQVPNGPNGKPDEKLREFGWCPPGCRCEANWSAREIEKAMNRTHPGFPDVAFSATAKIGKRWSDV